MTKFWRGLVGRWIRLRVRFGYEPSHPWAARGRAFDWEKERARQKREGERWTESDTDRRARERSVLP